MQPTGIYNLMNASTAISTNNQKIHCPLKQHEIVPSKGDAKSESN